MKIEYGAVTPVIDGDANPKPFVLGFGTRVESGGLKVEYY